MVLEWREMEHEEIDVVVEGDLGAQVALKICRLYKFWALKGMRTQVRLL
jgi:ribosomal protein S13